MSAQQGRITQITGTHLAHLDGLRGLAILLVMVYHFCLPHAKFLGRDPGPLLQILQVGWMGVDLFFVLSGFLISSILIETREQPHYFRNFLARRFLRIWPLYYVSLVVLLILLPMAMPEVPPQVQSMRDKQAWFWLYAANWLFAYEGGFTQTSGGFFWSLAVEEQFYLLWPVVVYLASERNLLRISLALLASSLVLRIVLVAFGGVGVGSLYTITFTHLDGLAVGSCVSVCMRSSRLSERLLRAAPLVALCSVAALVATRISDGDLFFWSRAMAVYGYTPIALMFGALLVLVLGGRGPLKTDWLLRTAFMRLCGKYSYALYMVHVPIAGLVFPLVTRSLKPLEPLIGYDLVILLGAVVAFAVSWMAALASWHLFEKHILALKRHFTYSQTKTMRPVPAIAGSIESTPGR